LNENIDPFREWDAAYVLGALGMDERRAYEQHLETCLACSHSVGQLAGIPGILKKISPETALGIADAPTLEARSDSPPIQILARQVIQRRKDVRRKLVSAMAVAAAFLMVIGIGIGTNLKGSTTGSTNPISVSASAIQVLMSDNGKHEMSVDMKVTSKKWGTQLVWNCTYVQNRTEAQAPEYYDLVLTKTSGDKVVVATWRVLGQVAKDLAAATNIPVSEIRSLEIRETGKTSPIVTGVIAA
jgi:hypothetical protein